MAVKTTVTVVDDVTGKEGPPADGFVEGFTFSLGDKHFKFDIGPETVARIEKAMAPFIAKATPVEAPKKSGAKPASDARKAWNKKVIDWSRTSDLAMAEGAQQKSGYPSKKLIALWVKVNPDDPRPE